LSDTTLQPTLGGSPARARRGMPAALELLKPITWFPPMWAFMCGLVSSGVAVGGRWGMVALGVLLCGPLVCGTSQAVNDWFDRHVDAINEPNRPIPSGRIPGRQGLYIAIGWSVVSLLAACLLGRWVLSATVVGLVLAWAYSAPPVRLKLNGWWGNLAVGACYEGLPWVTGAAAMTVAMPDWRAFVLAALYSAGGHGIMTLNDFKSIEGDRRMGVFSLPVQMGVEHAARFACVVMAMPQTIVITLLVVWGWPIHGAIVGVLLVVQFALMARFMRRPADLAIWYNGTGTTLFVLGMLVSAFALRGILAGGILAGGL
jgi:chlorophyll synthase